MTHSNKFLFYSRKNYFQQLIQDAAGTKRGDRIAVETMAFDPREPLVDKLMHILIAAAARGVDVKVAVDAYSFLMSYRPLKLGPLWSHTDIPDKLHEPFRARWGLLEQLKAAGGDYIITNKPTHRFTIPHAGRSHIKFAVVQNKIYIGGHNLTNSQEIDIMVSREDAQAANWAYGFITALCSLGTVRTVLKNQDQRIPLKDNATLLVDAGVPHQSIIRDTALHTIDEATEWIFLTCQYFPGGQIAQHLLAAHRRGVAVQIIYNHPHTHGKEALGHHLYNLRERMRLPAEFFAGQLPKRFPRLHAKLLATEQGAILGSHNYVDQGVNLGTAEIALMYSDPMFAREAIAMITETLKTLNKR